MATWMRVMHEEAWPAGRAKLDSRGSEAPMWVRVRAARAMHELAACPQHSGAQSTAVLLSLPVCC
jgi:hypothetical protein